jgi:hypothetical protein
MTRLSDLYDGDKALTRDDVQALRPVVRAPHPLHGVRYSDGVILCGRSTCRPCRDYRTIARQLASA